MTNEGGGPVRVQIQTQSGCNGRCVFCPNDGIIKAALPQGQMSPTLYQRIVDQLAPLAPRRISPYLMNEPLLDKRLPEFVRYTAERVPEATTLITSNGTHLSLEMGAALIDAGLKRLKVSVQSLDPAINKQLMGPACDSDKIVQNVIAFRRLIREKRSRLDLRVSMIVTKHNEAEIESTRRFWKRNGVRLVTSALENRGGNIDQAGELNPHGLAPFRQSCTRPFRDMCVLWSGEVVLCCVDWFRTTILGNLAEQSVLDVWQGPRVLDIRRGLKEDDVETLPKVCINCAESAKPSHHRKGLKGRLSRLFS